MFKVLIKFQPHQPSPKFLELVLAHLAAIVQPIALGLTPVLSNNFIFACISQLAEDLGLNPGQCKFDSCCKHHAHLIQLVEVGASKALCSEFESQSEHHASVVQPAGTTVFGTVYCGFDPHLRQYGIDANWKAASLLKRCPSGLKVRDLPIPPVEMIRIGKGPVLKTGAAENALQVRVHAISVCKRSSNRTEHSIDNRTVSGSCPDVCTNLKSSSRGTVGDAVRRLRLLGKLATLQLVDLC